MTPEYKRSTKPVMSIVRIEGSIGQCQPDPAAPTDPQSRWIGMVTASWVAPVPCSRKAAILKIATGRVVGDQQWGQDMLVLRWIGDYPPPEIAQAVYDVIRDGGPEQRDIRRVIEAMPCTEYQASYRSARAAS